LAIFTGSGAEKNLKSRPRTNLVLTGFMGTGKTAIGRVLAQRLNMDFVDTDQEIEALAGMTVNEIFARRGEEYFRRIEEEAVKKAASRQHCVIATGGGVVLRPQNVQALRESGYIVCLKASPEVICERVKDQLRPLLLPDGSEKRIREILTQREPFYREADWWLDTSFLDLETAVERIKKWFEEKINGGLLGYRQVWVELGPASYPIIIGSGLLSRLGEMVAERVSGRRCLLITNPTVGQHYAEPARASLEAAGMQVTMGVIPDGEEFKTLETAGKLFSAAVEGKLERDCPVIALGGGVVGDVAGFVAATYMRGVPLVQVPTSLLAQVDSSVGGKVAVNHPAGKNLIGAFYQPRLVLIDLNTLRTLPQREMRAGMAEVIKYGVIWDREFFSFLETALEEALALQEEALLPLVKRCCEIKAEIVSQDEREHGIRAFLNFGHTVGHAVEAVTSYTLYRHGEAVAIGMAAAGYLALEMGFWREEDFLALRQLLVRAGLPVSAPGISRRLLREFMEHDKKKQKGVLRWVIPKALGKVVIVDNIPEEMIESALAKIAVP